MSIEKFYHQSKGNLYISLGPKDLVHHQDKKLLGDMAKDIPDMFKCKGTCYTFPMEK